MQKIEWDFISKDGATEAVDSTTESGDAGLADRVAVLPVEVAPGEVASCVSGEENNNKSPKGVRDETPGFLGEEVQATYIDYSATDLLSIMIRCLPEVPTSHRRDYQPQCMEAEVFLTAALQNVTMICIHIVFN